MYIEFSMMIILRWIFIALGREKSPVKIDRSFAVIVQLMSTDNAMRHVTIVCGLSQVKA